MDKKSFIRIIIAILTSLNTVLTALDMQIIPDDLINALVIIAGYGFELFTMYKNNYLTSKGKKQKEVLEREGLY